MKLQMKIIVYYFDLLTELRAFDLKRLLIMSGRIKDRIIFPKHNDNEFSLINYSDTILSRLGLINVPSTWSTEHGKQIDYRKIDSFDVTKLGFKFIEFLGY